MQNCLFPAVVSWMEYRTGPGAPRSPGSPGQSLSPHTPTLDQQLEGRLHLKGKLNFHKQTKMKKAKSHKQNTERCKTNTKIQRDAESTKTPTQGQRHNHTQTHYDNKEALNYNDHRETTGLQGHVTIATERPRTTGWTRPRTAAVGFLSAGGHAQKSPIRHRYSRGKYCEEISSPPAAEDTRSNTRPSSSSVLVLTLRISQMHILD